MNLCVFFYYLYAGFNLSVSYFYYSETNLCVFYIINYRELIYVCLTIFRTQRQKLQTSIMQVVRNNLNAYIQMITKRYRFFFLNIKYTMNTICTCFKEFINFGSIDTKITYRNQVVKQSLHSNFQIAIPPLSFYWHCHSKIILEMFKHFVSLPILTILIPGSLICWNSQRYPARRYTLFP